MRYLFIGGIANGQWRDVEKTQVSIPKPGVPKYVDHLGQKAYSKLFSCDDYTLRSFTNTETKETVSLMVLTRLTDEQVEDILNRRREIEELTRMDTDDMLPVKQARI